MGGAYRQPSREDGPLVNVILPARTGRRPMSYTRPPGLPIVDAMTPAVLVLDGPVTRDEGGGRGEGGERRGPGAVAGDPCRLGGVRCRRARAAGARHGRTARPAPARGPA